MGWGDGGAEMLKYNYWQIQQLVPASHPPATFILPSHNLVGIMTIPMTPNKCLPDCVHVAPVVNLFYIPSFVICRFASLIPIFTFTSLKFGFLISREWLMLERVFVESTIWESRRVKCNSKYKFSAINIVPVWILELSSSRILGPGQLSLSLS